VPLQWRRLFPRNGKPTLRGRLRTTFAFKAASAEIWRASPAHTLPGLVRRRQRLLSSEQEGAPKGDALIYFVEGQDSPANRVHTRGHDQGGLGRQPATLCLTPSAAASVPTIGVRAGVRRAAPVAAPRPSRRSLKRATKSKRRTTSTGPSRTWFILSTGTSPNRRIPAFCGRPHHLGPRPRQRCSRVEAFLDALEQIARQIPQEYNAQKENMKSFA